MASLKGPGAPQTHDGSSLRIAIVHARWNPRIISALVHGAQRALAAAGVRPENITVQDVPGSYELPLAVQRVYEASRIQRKNDMDGSVLAFDAVVAVGVLVKGETMHFEYIAEAASQGLMRVQLDMGVPVVFGLLTVLTEEQGMARAGFVGGEEGRGHNHGEDWGRAAVELGVKRREWGDGRMV